jgi:glycosyltransferase involved in cell wall biosynthesis
MSALRILFNAYPTHCQGGGGVVKLRKLRDHLRARGHQVDLFDPWTTDVRGYQIYHHFSWYSGDRPLLRYVRAEGVQVVVETMYWESLRYLLQSAELDGPRRIRGLAGHGLKLVLPWLAPRRRVLATADLLMPNSAIEARLLRRHFGIDPGRIVVAPNGADRRFADASPEPFASRFGLKEFVLCTGMIEARKNQLALIRALAGTGIPLVLIGACPAVHRPYLERCRAAADHSVHFLGPIDHDDPLLASAYAAARVLALPSWHETTGKSALEAGLCAKQVIMTRFAPAAREYLGDLATYVHPGDVAGLRRALLAAYEAPPNEALRQRVLDRYLWDQVVPVREQAYRSLLSGQRG